MKNLDKALENLKYDTRMTHWNMNNDILTKTELDSHLSNLQDLSSEFENVTLEGTEIADTVDESVVEAPVATTQEPQY